MATPFIVHDLLGEPNYPAGEELAVLGSGYGLYAQGVLTNGHAVWSAVAEGKTLLPTASRAPLYPVFLAAVMALDPTFLETTECILRYRDALPASPCTPDYGSLPWFQAGFASIALLAVFVAGYLLTGSILTAFLASGFAAMSSTYMGLVDAFAPVVLAVPLLTVSCILLFLAARHGGAGRWLSCGLVVGLLPLTLAPLRFVPIIVLFVILCSWLFGRPQIAGIPPGEWLRRSWRGALLAAIPLVLGYLVIVGPWLGRNFALFGDPVVTRGADLRMLEPRLAYNRMTGGEWAVAFVYWLPDFGDSLAERLFDPSLHRRLDIGAPDGFYNRGRDIIDDDVELAGVPPLRPRADYILEQELVGNLWKHVFVTLPLVWRGLFVAKYWSLVTFVALAVVTVVVVRRRWDGFLFFALPPIGLLLFNAFLTINLPQQNFGMIAPSALAMAVVTAWVGKRLRLRLTGDPPSASDTRESASAQIAAPRGRELPHIGSDRKAS